MNVRTKKYLWQGIAFGFFFLIVTWKLTNAGLWYDESVEFAYSTVPLSEMYSRVVSTYQPPLYNFLLHFWLKISESEFWFRFSSVVFGLIGSLGVYRSVEKQCGYRIACLAVMLFGTSYHIVYYLQECAEYALLLCTVPWLCYFFFQVMDAPTTRNTAAFVIACILSVYSQYGAAFLVIAACVVVLGHYLIQKDWKAVKKLAIGYVLAGGIAGVPLLWFFLMPQKTKMTAHSSGIEPVFEKGPLNDLWISFCRALQWIFLDDTSEALGTFFKLCMVILLILILVEVLANRHPGYRGAVIMSVLTFVIYYVAAKFGLYGETNYSSGIGVNRYCLFLGPVWLILIVDTVGLLYRQTLAWQKGTIVLDGRKRISAGWIARLLGVTLAALVLASGHNLLALNNNWTKEDIRGAVAQWYSKQGYTEPTFVYYASKTGFQYYLEHNEAYLPEYSANLHYQPWSRGITEEEFSVYLDEKYADGLPPKIYFIASHIDADMNNMLKAFKGKGYKSEQLFKGTKAQLYVLTMPPQEDTQS